jgi:hypothetical protein
MANKTLIVWCKISRAETCGRTQATETSGPDQAHSLGAKDCGQVVASDQREQGKKEDRFLVIFIERS